MKVVEIIPPVPPFPPRRTFDVFLRPEEAEGATGIWILSSPDIPVQNEIHTACEPPHHVTRRGATKVGPARWAVSIHYGPITPETES